MATIKSLACRLQRNLAIKNEETLLLSYGLLQDTMSEEFCNQIIGNGGPINCLPNNSKVCDNIDPCWISFLKRQKQTKLDLGSPSFSTSLSLSQKAYNHFEKALGTIFCFFLWDLNKQINPTKLHPFKEETHVCTYYSLFFIPRDMNKQTNLHPRVLYSSLTT